MPMAPDKGFIHCISYVHRSTNWYSPAKTHRKVAHVTTAREVLLRQAMKLLWDKA